MICRNAVTEEGTWAKMVSLLSPKKSKMWDLIEIAVACTLVIMNYLVEWHLLIHWNPGVNWNATLIIIDTTAGPIPFHWCYSLRVVNVVYIMKLLKDYQLTHI